MDTVNFLFQIIFVIIDGIDIEYFDIRANTF